MPGRVVISATVEGIVDESVIRKLVTHAGAIPGNIYGKNGKQHIRQKIQGYNSAAQRSPWIVFVDLDNEANCAPDLRGVVATSCAPYVLPNCGETSGSLVAGRLLRDAMLCQYRGTISQSREAPKSSVT